MTIAFKSTSKEIKVQAIIPVQLQNQLSGLASCLSKKRIAAPCGFFMRSVRTRISMVGYVGAQQCAPGSFFDRLRQPCVVHHPRLALKVVNPLSEEGFTND